MPQMQRQTGVVNENYRTNCKVNSSCTQPCIPLYLSSVCACHTHTKPSLGELKNILFTLQKTLFTQS